MARGKPAERPLWIEVTGSLVFIILGASLLIHMADELNVGIRDPIGTWGMPRIYSGALLLLGLSLFPYRRVASREWVGRKRKEVDWRVVLQTYSPIIGVFAYAWVMPRLGFLVTTFLFGLILLRVLGVKSWYVLIGLPTLLPLTIWFLFTQLLYVRFPQGILF